MTWKLLSETRRICLRTALIGLGLSLMLVFAQTVGGALSGLIVQGWGWTLLVLLPPFLMLWASAMLNRYPAKILHPGGHQALFWGTLAYYTFILITLLAEPLATREDLSIEAYLAQSLWWLLPLQALLIVGYWLVFYRKDSIFKANEKIILDFAEQKANEWKEKGHVLRHQCFELVAANDMPAVFEKIRSELEKSGSDALKEVVMYQGQFTSLSRERDLNTIDPEKAKIELNRIVQGVLNLIEKL